MNGKRLRRESQKHNLQQRDRPARKTNRPVAKGKSQPSRTEGKGKDKKQKPKAKSGGVNVEEDAEAEDALQKQKMIKTNHRIRMPTMSLPKPVKTLRNLPKATKSGDV